MKTKRGSKVTEGGVPILDIVGGIGLILVGICIILWMVTSVFSLFMLSCGTGPGGTGASPIAKGHHGFERVWESKEYAGNFLDYKVRIGKKVKETYYQTDNPFLEPIVIVFSILFDIKQKNTEWSVHLETRDENIRPYAVTGRDYDGDGKFDSISIVETPKNGYNTIYKNWWGWSKVEPCLADKDKNIKFTKAQINQAVSLLKEALSWVYNEDNLHKDYVKEADNYREQFYRDYIKNYTEKKE